MIAPAGGVVLVLVALAVVWWDAHGERWRRARAYRTRLTCAVCHCRLDRGSDRKFYGVARNGTTVVLCDAHQRTWTG